MSLIILEGLDRTGKSSLAEIYKEQGYEIIHMSAPDKKYKSPGYAGPSYLDDMIDIITSAANRDIVLDRSYFGELIWPHVYGREPVLTEDDIEILMEIEETVSTKRILMHDPNVEAHWQRCVDNKEPLTRGQFLKARTLYDRMATKYKFEKLVLSDVEGYEKPQEKPQSAIAQTPVASQSEVTAFGTGKTGEVVTVTNQHPEVKSKEQIKLEKANAINEILSKRIVKSKGQVFDDIETEIRLFLNTKLGTILGNEDPESLSKEEVFYVRALVKRLKEKETVK